MKATKFMILPALLLAMSACTEDVMDHINKDTSNPGVGIVSPKFQITDAIMSTGFTTTSGDYSFYVASLTEQEVGTGNNQLSNAELRKPTEWTASTTFNNVWNATYSNILNLKQIIAKTSEGGIGEGQYDLQGMAQVLEAVNFGVLTDMHGDIPYSEACKGQECLQPKIDDQKDVYTGIIASLDAAIANFEKGASMKSAGAQDLLFNNDIDAWAATAHALKARYLLHMSAVDASNIDKALAEAQAAIDGGFDGCAITNFNGVDCDNPWSAYVWSRDYTTTSKTVTDMMEATDDPRMGVYTYWSFMGFEPGNESVAKSSGGSQLGAYPAWIDLGAQPLTIIGVPEVYFIIAECQARKGEDCTEAFQAGVAASVDEITGYGLIFGDDPYDGADFAASLGTPDLKMVMEQKFLSQIVDQQVEAWNDIRRCEAMGTSFITLTNPCNTQSGVNRMPNILPYGNSSVLSNPNVAAAYGDGMYIYTKKAWLYSK